ncbi:MAG: hypothetical protein NTV34_20000, partial [Proteobacteria bacterium]|nr:hypothetical protein [Pseudomonadota bacterium]
MNTFSGSSAEENLQNAVNTLSTTASAQLNNAVESMGKATAEGVSAISDSLIKGLKDIKSELNISHLVEKSPLGFVTGSFLAGAIFEYATARASSAPTPLKSDDTENASGVLPYLPLLVAATQWGMTKLRE